MQGAKKNFTSVWDEFSDRVRTFLARRVSNAFHVDDLVQEVFLKIHIHIDEVKEESRLSSWIFTIASNTLTDFFRRQKTPALPLEEESVAAQEGPDCSACEIAAGLEGMARALPPIYAQAIALVDFEGLSFDEAARRMSVSVSGAKSRVQRARKMIRDSLLRCCHFVFDRYGTIIDYYPACCCCSSASRD
ncbi:MAG: RNA polymerase sigma factor SigZ [Spirochaetia bacterium]